MKFREAYAFFIIGIVVAIAAVIDDNKWLYFASGIFFFIGLAEVIITDLAESWERAQKKKRRQQK